MAKINIGAVSSGSPNYSVVIYLTEKQTVNGQEVDVPIGEAVVAFNREMSMDDIKDKIVDAANKIMDAHKDAIDKKKDLEELDFPDIE